MESYVKISWIEISNLCFRAKRSQHFWRWNILQVTDLILIRGRPKKCATDESGHKTCKISKGQNRLILSNKESLILKLHVISSRTWKVFPASFNWPLFFAIFPVKLYPLHLFETSNFNSIWILKDYQRIKWGMVKDSMDFQKDFRKSL